MANPSLISDTADATRLDRFYKVYQVSLSTVGLASLSGIYFINRLHKQAESNVSFRIYYRYLGFTALSLLFFTWAETERVKLDKEMCMKYFGHVHDLEMMKALAGEKR